MGDLYLKTYENEEDLKKITGLKSIEFEALHERFSDLWILYFSQFTLEGRPRLRQSSSRKNNIFRDTREVLLFGLMYLKNDILQEDIAKQFGIDQPKVSRYLNLVKKLIKQSIDKGKVLPTKKQEWLLKQLE